jgi:hypothetical protein
MGVTAARPSLAVPFWDWLACLQAVFRPAGAFRFWRPFPWLTPWAACFRRFAAATAADSAKARAPIGLSKIRHYPLDNVIWYSLSGWKRNGQAQKPAGPGHGGEEPGRVVGQRERLRARSFGPLEKARAFRMTPWTESDFVPQKPKNQRGR